MKEVVCPICESSTELTEDRICQICGAPFEEFLEEEPSVEGAQQEEASQRPTDEEQDELLQAFRKQFEENQVEPPASWSQRLRQLALEAEESRRVATVIFVDLRGYTRLTRVLPEADLDALRQWFCDVCTRRVEQYDGFVIQFLGDCVFAAFGAPWAFERDAEAAVRCLLDIRRDIDKREPVRGEKLAIRAGASTGVVNLRLLDEGGRRRPDLFGSPVNLAARLEGKADTGEILISEWLANQVAGSFEMEPRKAFLPKNYGREITPYAVIAWKGTNVVRRRHDIPFVGRDVELSCINDQLAAIASGQFRAVLLSGIAGSGKTRLFRTAMGAAITKGKIRFLSYQLEPQDRHIVLSPLLHLVKRLFEKRTEDEMIQFISEHLDPVLVPPMGYLLRIDPHFSEVRSLPAKDLRDAVLRTLLAFFSALAQEKPTVIMLDDFQWLDGLTLTIIDHLVKQQPSSLGVVLIGRDDLTLARDGEEKEATLEAVISLDTWEKIELGPLPEKERHELVGHLLNEEALHPLIRKRLFEETEGLPLYLVEMASELAGSMDRQSIEVLAEALTLDDERASSPLVDLLQARIDRLDALHRAILQCAAIIGHHFTYSLLSEYSDVEANLLEELYTLRGMRFVRDEDVPEDIQFAFTPSVVRDLAYQMLTDKQRERLHTLLAETLETKFEAKIEQAATALAFHWSLSERPSRARPYMRKAATQATALGVPQEAYLFLKRALERESDPESQSAATPAARTATLSMLHELAGRAARSMGRYHRAMAHFQAWNELALKSGNRVWLTNCAHQMAVTQFEQGYLEEARELLDTALAEDKGPEVRLLPLRKTRGSLLYREGRFQEALEVYLSVAESTASNAASTFQGDAWNNAALCCWRLGEIEKALEYSENAEAIFDRLGHAYGAAMTANNRGIFLEKLGRLQSAAGCLRKSLELSERIGYIHMMSAVLANLSNIEFLCQRYEESHKNAARSLHFAEMIGHRNSIAIAHINLALALDGLQEHGQARTEIEKAITASKECSERDTEIVATLEAAWIALRDDRIDESRVLLTCVTEDDVSGEQQHWRLSIIAVLDSLETGEVVTLLTQHRIQEDQPGMELAAALRRIDASLEAHIRVGLTAHGPLLRSLRTSLITEAVDC